MSSATVILRGLAESIIVTRLDELSIKAIMGNGRSISYRGDISGTFDGIKKQAHNVNYEGEHLLVSSYEPLQNFLDHTEVIHPLYVSTIGSLLHYLMDAISQRGGQEGNIEIRGKQKFGRYIRKNLPASLSHASFKDLLSAYERYFQAQTSFNITPEAEARMDELDNIYRLLKSYGNLFTRNYIQNLILLHDSNFVPVANLRVIESETKSMVEESSKGKLIVDDESIVGYKCEFSLQNGRVIFQPLLAVEKMEIEGEFQLKLRHGKTRRITSKINVGYPLKGDWEARVRGRAHIEIGALAYWRGNEISKSDIKVNFEGELL